MLAALKVEGLKLNRSLASVLAVAAPTLIAILVFFNMLRDDEPQAWTMWLQTSVGIWAFFMLPMSVTALTALVAHMEHGPRAWDHLRALPVRRWKIYAAKAAWVILIVAAMSFLNLALTFAAVSTAAAIKPALAPTGPLDFTGQAAMMGRVVLAGLLLTAIQL